MDAHRLARVRGRHRAASDATNAGTAIRPGAILGAISTVVVLTSVPPDATTDRRRQLISAWTALGLVAEDASPDAQERIESLCRPIMDNRAVDLDLLQSRSQMLSDVRAAVAAMKEGLFALLDSIGADGERLSTDEGGRALHEP
jgi:hypothetical protein